MRCERAEGNEASRRSLGAFGVSYSHVDLYGKIQVTPNLSPREKIDDESIASCRIKDILSMGHHIIDCDLIGRWRNMTGDTLGIWMVLVADWHSSTRVEDEDF